MNLSEYAAYAACRVLPPALLHRLIVLAGARRRIGRLGVPIALKKDAEAVVAPVVAARNPDIDRRPAHQEAALGLVVEHRDELGAIVGLAAQRLVRDDAAATASAFGTNSAGWEISTGAASFQPQTVTLNAGGA